METDKIGASTGSAEEDDLVVSPGDSKATRKSGHG